jgi:hypothetical protein
MAGRVGPPVEIRALGLHVGAMNVIPNTCISGGLNSN